MYAIHDFYSNWSISSSGFLAPFSDTTCSWTAWARGSHQRVVAFSFFGAVDSGPHEQRKYFEGVEQNLGALASHYGQGWIMRLYHNLGPQHPLHTKICALACSSPQLDLCYVPELHEEVRAEALSVFPTMWRFLPVRDPQVEVLLSRDLDSRLSSREAAAVAEWLASGHALHTMRDHFSHRMPMMAGMWGVRLTREVVRARWASTWRLILGESRVSQADYGVDQQVLERYVWPWAREDSMQHDSFSCASYPGSLGFPAQRINQPENFVGRCGQREQPPVGGVSAAVQEEGPAGVETLLTTSVQQYCHTNKGW